MNHVLRRRDIRKAKAMVALDRLIAFAIIFATTVMLWFSTVSCAGLPVELCVDHPTYGQVCLVLVEGRVTMAIKLVNGKKGQKLDEAARAELERWNQEKPPE